MTVAQEDLSFDVSLLELALALSMSTDSVSQCLYEQQKRGLVSYTFSEPSLYVKVLPHDSHRPIALPCNDESSLLAETFNSWLWGIAKHIHTTHATRCSDTSRKLLDMWRLGVILTDSVDFTASIDETTHGEPVPASEGKTSDVHQKGSRQHEVMDFICYYMEYISPQRTISLSDNMNPCMLKWKNLFDAVPLPFAVQFERFSREDIEKVPCINKAVRSVAVLLRDPNLAEIVNNFMKISQVTVSSPEGRVARNHSLVLYAIRVLYGLSSKNIQSAEWKDRGHWMTSVDISFTYLWGIGEFLCGQKDIKYSDNTA